LSQHHKAKNDALDTFLARLHHARERLETAAQASEAAINSEKHVYILEATDNLAAVIGAIASASLTPPTNDVLSTVVNPSKAIEAIDATGGVSDKATCAAQSTVSVWRRAEPGGKGSFVVTARDDQGVQRNMGGDTVTVVFEQPLKIHVAGAEAGVAGAVAGVSVDDRCDGTYEVSFPLDQLDEQNMSVLINGSPTLQLRIPLVQKKHLSLFYN